MEQKKKHIKTVHQKLRVFRAKDPMLSVFMWGINYSINELSHVKMPGLLMPDDFKAYSKVKCDNQLFNKANMPSHYKFKVYCPWVFRNLRERLGVDEEQYLDSLTKHSPVPMESTGRSGARFWLSHDRVFVIKMIGSEDVIEMHRLLQDYHQHVVEQLSDILLPHYLGMYRVTHNDSESYVIVMRNIFSPRIKIHKKFDLKGSSVARQASEKEKSKEVPMYKDNDFVSEGIKIHIGAAAKQRLMNTLKSDTDFLTHLNMMDYSLLVGIHDMDSSGGPDLAGPVEGAEVSDEDGEDEEAGGDQNSPPDSPEPTGASPTVRFAPVPFSGELDAFSEKFAIKCAIDCPRHEIYFVGLIDILTHYGVKKRTAAAAKTVKYGAGAEISTVKPEQYARRFMEFIDRVVE